jgi:UDP-glucuronate 4-epimerase
VKSDFKPDPDQTYLVTGAAGFIGYFLAKRLLEQGCRVVGIDNLNDYYDINLKHTRIERLQPSEKFTFIKNDISNKESINNIFAEHKPGIVVNLAAQAGVRYSITNPERYIQSNIIGFFNILEACRYNPVDHLVYASSSSVYGANKKTPFSEEDFVDNPISLYAATKKSNELMAYTYSHLYGIPATGLRFFTVYGPMGRPDMAYFSFTQKILSGQAVKVFNHGDMYRDFTYIDDIVEGVVRVICKPPEAGQGGARHRVFNIGNNSPEKLTVFIETLEKALSKAIGRDIVAPKEFLPMQPGDVPRTYADTTALEQAVGFKPSTSIEEGLTKFAEWYCEYYSMKKIYRI